MDKTDGAPAATGISQADHDKAVNSARTEGATEAGKAAQARIKAILGSEEAKGRADLANHLAFETDMSAEASVALLAKSPKGEAPKTAPSIAERHDLALGGISERVATKTAANDLKPSAIYESRRKAVGK
jgi:hypothetical protein